VFLPRLQYFEDKIAVALLLPRASTYEYQVEFGLFFFRLTAWLDGKRPLRS